MRFQLLVAAALMLAAIRGQAQTPPAPPRNVADILAVLDQYKPDSAAVETSTAAASALPPVVGDLSDLSERQKLAVFFHRRARANGVIGKTAQEIADLLPIEDVGLITTDGLIKIRSVDGKPMADYRRFKTSGLYSGGRYQLHLLPGVHVLTMGFHDDRGGGTISWSTSDVTKTVTIGKGQVIHLALSRDGKSWSAKEFDGASALPAIKGDFGDLISAK